MTRGLVGDDKPLASPDECFATHDDMEGRSGGIWGWMAYSPSGPRASLLISLIVYMRRSLLTA